jgi:hypothetical protein
MLNNPIGVVGRHQLAVDEQNDVDEPPEAESAQCDHLADRDADVTQRVAIDGEQAEEDRIEERGQEVVRRVLDARNVVL